MYRKLIQRAIEESKPMEIIYQKQDQIVQRLVKPSSLRGDLMVAWDYMKHAPRTYHICNILSAQIREEHGNGRPIPFRKTIG